VNKYVYTLIVGFILSLQHLHAGGPWLVYNFKAEGTYHLLVLNLDDPQYAFKETDSDEDVWLEYSSSPKRIWKHTYDGDNTSGISTQNQWHRLSWGREGNKFGLLYSQYEVVGAEGTADHGVFFATGTCVAWPNKGKSIGLTGKYPQTLKFQMLRLDGGWSGDRFTTGSRYLGFSSWTANLDTTLTKALNDARGTLSTNLDAKNWIINYFVTTLRYTQTADVNDD
jgi:hypothetical protein